MRDFFVTFSTRVRVLRWRLGRWADNLILRVIDAYLERRGEQRAMIVPTFEELDVLYEYDKLPVMYRDHEFDIAIANGPVDVV